MIRTILALVEVDEAGRIVTADPGSFRAYEEWSVSEFEQFRADALEAVETAGVLSHTARRNEARLALVLDAASRAGIFRAGGVNLSPVLRPYFDAYLVEYEQRRSLSRRVGQWLGRANRHARHFLLNVILRGAGHGFSWLWRELQTVLKK